MILGINIIIGLQFNIEYYDKWKYDYYNNTHFIKPYRIPVHL